MKYNYLILILILLSGCASPTLKLVNHVGPITYKDPAEFSSKITSDGLEVVAFRSVHRFMPDTQKDYDECSKVLNDVATDYEPVKWNEVKISSHEYNGVTGIANTTCEFTFKSKVREK